MSETTKRPKPSRKLIGALSAVAETPKEMWEPKATWPFRSPERSTQWIENEHAVASRDD